MKAKDLIKELEKNPEAEVYGVETDGNGGEFGPTYFPIKKVDINGDVICLHDGAQSPPGPGVLVVSL